MSSAYEALDVGVPENRKLGMKCRPRQELALHLSCPDQQFTNR
jgi:hypothetical protein